MATINTPQLTNTNISDTYLGVLHARGVPLSATGQTKIHDGSGEISALSLGRQNQGASITGNLTCNSTITGSNVIANQLTMPRIDTGIDNHIVVRSGTGTLALSGFSDVFNAVYSLPNGTYVNPRITVANGLITGIESRGAVRNFVWRVVPLAPSVPVGSFGAEGTVSGITGIEGAVQTASLQTFLQNVWPLGVSPNITGTIGDIAIVTQYGKKATLQARISFAFYDVETYISTAVFKRVGSTNTGTDWVNNGYANTNYFTNTNHNVYATTTTFSATNYLIS